MSRFNWEPLGKDSILYKLLYWVGFWFFAIDGMSLLLSKNEIQSVLAGDRDLEHVLPSFGHNAVVHMLLAAVVGLLCILIARNDQSLGCYYGAITTT